MKKTMIPLTLAAMLLLAGCSQSIDMGDTPASAVPDTTQGVESRETPEETPEDMLQETPQETPAEEVQETPSAAPSTAGEPAEQGSALAEDDFRIVVDGVTIAIGADPVPVFDAFGGEAADESALLGWTDESHTHKIYRYDYEDFYIFVNTEVETEASGISLIGLTNAPTGRGVGPGDSYEDMLAQYGEPDKEKSDEGMMDCIYRSGERAIFFILNENDAVITLIEIQ